MDSELLERAKAKAKEREQAQAVKYPNLQRTASGDRVNSGIVYWYIWGYRTGTGRPFIRGIYNSEKEAEEREYSMTDAINTHIVPLKTHDYDEAARQIRPMIADETNSVGQAMRRFKHSHDEECK